MTHTPDPEPRPGTPDGAVAFARYLVPPLRSGTITLTAVQQITAGSVVESFQNVRTLHVTGQRYRLAAGTVDSVFPPSGAQGEFTGTLPHVVLTQPTLPWQRTPGGTTLPVREAAASGPGAVAAASWLAVLLFDELDPAPVPAAGTIGDLKPDGTVFFPARTAEPGEKDSDPVTTIDVPAALFDAVAPAAVDLGWLAHSRQVDSAAKAVPSGAAAPGPDYAVVVGNRLPATDSVCTAHLVSLEGYGPYLPAEDGTSALPLRTTAVRLVSLYSWRFTAVDLKQTFQDLLEAVDADPAGLQLPSGPSPGPQSPADQAVRDAFGLGYTALDHTLRGGSTVSWYRGPLLPLGTPLTAAPPYQDSDQLLRYDPTTGMFDTSYAAAWQLGQLLALHDGSFAPALYRWKASHTEQAAAALEAEILDQALPAAPESVQAAPADPRHRRFLRAVTALVGPAAAALAAAREAED